MRKFLKVILLVIFIANVSNIGFCNEGTTPAPAAACDAWLGKLFNACNENPELTKAIKEKPALIDSFKKLDGIEGDAFRDLKKDPDFLKKFDKVANDVGLNDHIFRGHIEPKFKPDGTQYWDAGGVHSKKAIDDGFADYRGTQDPVGPEGLGYYKSKVKVYDPSFPQNGGWKSKGKASTFFPDSWSIEKIQAEITKVLKDNPRLLQVEPNGRKLFGGVMSDGVELRVWINLGGGLESAFPFL